MMVICLCIEEMFTLVYYESSVAWLAWLEKLFTLKSSFEKINAGAARLPIVFRKAKHANFYRNWKRN
jgi:hypothetical protein